MLTETTPFLSSLIPGLSLFYLLHVTLWRVRPSHSPRVFLLFFLMGMGIVLSVAIGVIHWKMDETALLALISCEFFLDVLYMYFYCGVARSVSLTLLWQLFLFRGRPVPLEPIVKEYASSSRFEGRLEVMSRCGVVNLNGDQVALTKRGVWITTTIKIIANILSGGLEG